MKKINLFYIAGAVLIAVSAFLLVFNQRKTTAFYAHTEQTLAQIQQLMPPRKAAVEGQYTDAAMPVCEIDGVDYCALLEVKKLGEMLPVADSWSSTDSASARYKGSAYDGTMIIGGKSLGFVTQLDIGDKITVTDILGGEFSYNVEKIDRVKELTEEKLSSEDYQLTVFSYIAKEKKYVVVRCGN